MLSSKHKKYILILAALIISFSLGRYSGQARVETREVEKIVYKESSEQKKNKDVVVTEKETKLPDGTIVKEKVTTVKEDTQKTTNKDLKSQNEKIHISANRPEWRISGGYGPNIPEFQKQEFNLHLQKRLLSELYIGIYGTSHRTFGLSIGLGF